MSYKKMFAVNYFYNRCDLEEELTIPDFEEGVRPLIDKAISVAEDALKKASLQQGALAGILLAGGTSQMPLVKDTLMERFKSPTVIVPNDLMWLIAKGAALHHKDLMSRPKEATRLILGSDLFLETFTNGRLDHTLLVSSRQILPHDFVREFSIDPDGDELTIQLVTESGTSTADSHRLTRREINIRGMHLTKIGVRGTIDANKTIKLSVFNPKTKIPLDNIDITDASIHTPEDLRVAREQYGFPNFPKRGTYNHQRYAVGIDLGTTTCEAVVWRKQEQDFVNFPHSGPLPSQAYVKNGTVKIAGIDMGSSSKGYFANFKVDIGNSELGNKYVVDGKKWPPEILSAHLLATIWEELQDDLGTAVSLREAVITIPSDFTADQTELVQNAARIAGIDTPILLYEPVAAFLAYAKEYPDILLNNQKFMVFDFGGGTTDVVIIETKQSEITILASSGNNSIGGKDLTNLISDILIERFAKKNSFIIPQEDIKTLRNKLTDKAEEFKIELSERLAGIE